mmetsp:Transcript_24759/g.60042  ORF Transcript_24759/g.60042 Transcript_24759/m.60042 type:complete len:221 (-) Transcript_24759:732-1394(-)
MHALLHHVKPMSKRPKHYWDQNPKVLTDVENPRTRFVSARHGTPWHRSSTPQTAEHREESMGHFLMNPCPVHCYGPYSDCPSPGAAACQSTASPGPWPAPAAPLQISGKTPPHGDEPQWPPVPFALCRPQMRGSQLPSGAAARRSTARNSVAPVSPGPPVVQPPAWTLHVASPAPASISPRTLPAVRPWPSPCPAPSVAAPGARRRQRPAPCAQPIDTLQ